MILLATIAASSASPISERRITNSSPPCRADRVVFADALGQPLGNLLQKTVADGMSECIVDVFEFIEIEEHDGGTPVVTFSCDQRLTEPVEQKNPVGSPVRKSCSIM